MKKRSRVLSVLLTATMVVGVAGCGSSDAASDNAGSSAQETVGESTEAADEAETEEVGQYTVLTDESGNPYDLGGMEIIIADWFSSGEEEEASSAYDEAHQEYLDWIQETYNFTIKQQAVTSWGDSPEDYVNYATTGGDENYVFTLYQGSALTSAIQSGLMYDLSTLDCLDFSESKWDSVVKDTMSKGDSVYAMRAMDHNDLESDATMEALNWALDMIDKYEMVYPEDAAWDYTYTAFANGEAVFTCAESYKAGDWADMEDDFGFVCFPMGPRMDHYVNYAQDNVFVIPSCYDAEKAWKIAFAFNLYNEPVPGFEDHEGWKDNYYKSFRDTESVDETLAIMVDSGVPMYDKLVNGIDMGPDLFWGISKDNTPAQKAESIRNTWQSYIDTANGK